MQGENNSNRKDLTKEMIEVNLRERLVPRQGSVLTAMYMYPIHLYIIIWMKGTLSGEATLIFVASLSVSVNFLKASLSQNVGKGWRCTHAP